MALEFPANPADGDVYPAAPNSEYVYNDAKGAWTSLPTESAKTITSDIAPVNAKDGDQWFNSIDGCLYIYYVDVDGGQWLQVKNDASFSSTLGPTVDALALKSPNYVINGGFDIWQRGNTINSVSNTAYTADMWSVVTDAVGTVNVSNVYIGAQAIGSRYALRAERSAGTNRWVVLGMFEGALSLIGKTLTFSAYIRKGSALTSDISLSVSTRTAKFGTSYDSASYTVSNSSLNTSTFTRVSFPITLTSATSAAGADLFEIEFSASQAGATNAFFELAGVQLEQGNIATTFRRANSTIQGELAACQRYFQIHSPNGYTNVQFNWPQNSYYTATLPVVMRAAPSGTATALGNCQRGGTMYAVTQVTCFTNNQSVGIETYVPTYNGGQYSTAIYSGIAVNLSAEL